MQTFMSLFHGWPNSTNLPNISETIPQRKRSLHPGNSTI